jgi:gentisate 1,2-dioxygenase
MSTALETSTANHRQEFYRRLAPRNLAPLWEVLRGLVPTEPKSKAVPYQWKYEAIRPAKVGKRSTTP